MSRTVLAVLVMLGVLGSTLSRELCLVTCASPSAHASAHHDGADAAGVDHACHDSGTSSLPTVSAVPHGCEHDSPEPPSTTVVASADYRCGGAAMAALPVVVATPAPSASCLQRPFASTQTRPALRPIGASVPLRI